MEYNTLINSKKIVIVYFYNFECIKTNRIFNNLKKKKINNCLLIDYDVENKKNEELLENIDLSCFPYFYIYKNGKMIDQILGTLNIEKILNQYLCT